MDENAREPEVEPTILTVEVYCPICGRSIIVELTQSEGGAPDEYGWEMDWEHRWCDWRGSGGWYVDAIDAAAVWMATR